MIKNLALLFISTAALAACSSDKAIVTTGDDGGGSGGSSSTPEGGTTTPPKTDAGSVPVHHIDRSGLTNVGTTGVLDYSKPEFWLCQPGNDPNECHTSLDSTEFLKDNTTQLDKHVVAEDPPFDCFYVYPTVLLNGNGNMTDFSDISITLDPLLAQGARFTRLCEVYAPLYRQVALSVAAPPASDAGAEAGAGTVTLGGDGKLAYGDVEAAFTYYMTHYNKGRKFVLIGHSQGTLMLTQLVANKIDNDAALRGQMISALLIGGGISVPVGKDVGGSFQNVPLCTKAAQTGCVIAYNSFAKDAPPPANSLFGRPPATGMMDACTNPLTLSGNTGRFRGSYSPVKFNNAVFKPDVPATMVPAVTTPFTMVRDLFNGSCVNQNGFSYLEVRPDQADDDKRPIPPYRNTPSESLGFGMHVADFSLEQDDLIDAVDLQAKAALK